jgi:hypothetical protein
MATGSRLIPQNTNNLQVNKFTFTLTALPFSSYMCQSVTFPGVATSEVMVETPFSVTYRHGDKLIYDPLVLTFMIDEDMRNWEETYNWLRGLTFPHDGSKEYVQQKKKGLYSDALLTVNRNSQTTNIRFKFTNCHPTALGPITFATMDDANNIPVADLTIRYDLFEVERINQPTSTVTPIPG